MSLNWVMLDAHKQPIPLPQERILSTTPTADVTLTFPGTPPRTITAPGAVYLTSERMIFVASQHAPSTSLFALVSQALPAAIKPPNADPDLTLESLSLPWLTVLSTSFVQPYFAANHLAMDIKPAPGGGLELGTRVEVRLSDQGMFEFIKRVEGVRAAAVERAREARIGEALPVYDPPPTAPQSDELPPGYSI